MRGPDERPIEQGRDERRRERAAILAELDDQFTDGASAIVVLDLEGTITEWNVAAEELYGWRAAQAVGRPISEVAVMPADRLLAEEVVCCVQDAGRWDGYLNGRRPDGSAVLAHLRLWLVAHEDGDPVGFLGVSVPAGRHAQRPG